MKTLRLLLVSVALPCLTSWAHAADVLAISATAFAPRDAATPNGDESQGLLANAQGRYFAPVVFPADGVTVCRFALVYRDFDSNNNIKATLKRKAVSTGGSAFTSPVVMASVSSNGFADQVRSAATATIADAHVRTGSSFYFVELDIPATTLEVLGVRITTDTACR